MKPRFACECFALREIPGGGSAYIRSMHWISRVTAKDTRTAATWVVDCPTTAVVKVVAELRSQTSDGFAVAYTLDKTRVARMRRITTAHLRLWKVPDPQAENIVLAVSELVTDGNPAPAVLRCADAVDETGRGLFLVAVFARNWGVSDDGMTTWCTFRVPERKP
ncbi:ATP-binding protein [Streptomyces sp. NPDC055036]